MEYGDGLMVVSGTKCDTSDMSYEFEFRSLVEGQGTGGSLEMQVADGAGPSDGTLGHDAVVTVVDDMLCGELPGLPAKPV